MARRESRKPHAHLPKLPLVMTKHVQFGQKIWIITSIYHGKFDDVILFFSSPSKAISPCTLLKHRSTKTTTLKRTSRFSLIMLTCCLSRGGLSAGKTMPILKPYFPEHKTWSAKEIPCTPQKGTRLSKKNSHAPMTAWANWEIFFSFCFGWNSSAGFQKPSRSTLTPWKCWARLRMCAKKVTNTR